MFDEENNLIIMNNCNLYLLFSGLCSDLRVWTLSSRGKSFLWTFLVWTSAATQTSPPTAGDQNPRTQRPHPGPGCRGPGRRLSAFPWNERRGPFWPSGSQVSRGRFPESRGLRAWEDPGEKGEWIWEETKWSILLVNGELTWIASGWRGSVESLKRDKNTNLQRLFL